MGGCGDALDGFLTGSAESWAEVREAPDGGLCHAAYPG